MNVGTVIEPEVTKRQSAVREPRRGAWLESLHSLVEVISSLRLTVVLLCLGVVLVFIGTLAQREEGLLAAQNRYFRSLLIWWTPTEGHWRFPVFPGGYLIGGVLLVNLLAAHARRFKFTKKKIGIFVIHAGIVLLILGQFATDLLSKESGMRLYQGETRNYSEAFRENELVIIDTSDPQHDRVYAIPDSRLAKGAAVRDQRLPVVVRVNEHWANADLVATRAEGTIESGATDGALKAAFVVPRPRVTDTDNRNLPAAVVELAAQTGPVGKFLVWTGTTNRQQLALNGKTYEIALRFTRHYYPFSLTLLKATHEQYKGTDIPKNFASRVRLENPSTQEARETVIYMNNPLRYAGLTFFQYQMTAGEMAAKAGLRPSSVLQVVHNPSWLTPYFSCVMVAAGLVIQFMSHLIGFAKKRRTA
jgi:hypothetical protein